MSTSVILGLWNSDQLQRIKIENVDLEGKVEVFKSQALKVVNNVSPNIELSFCGVILDNENTLSSYGVTPGVTIHILEKPKSKQPPSDKKLTESEVVSSFRTITLLMSFEQYCRLSRKEVVDKVIEATPGLEDDPAAIALIQDPELLVYLAHADTVAKLAKEHPILLEAAKHIISHVHEDQSNTSTSQASTSTGYSYSLEALSDDDMDSNSDTNITQHPLTRNSSFNAITAAQLAAAIANATNTQFNTNSAGMPSSTPTSSNIITNEMFSNAIQQALEAFGGANNGMFSPSTPTRNEEENIEGLSRRWEAQLQQMHEMGLVNDSVNMRALRATNGDVNAAIELVLSLSYDS